MHSTVPPFPASPPELLIRTQPRQLVSGCFSSRCCRESRAQRHSENNSLWEQIGMYSKHLCQERLSDHSARGLPSPTTPDNKQESPGEGPGWLRGKICPQRALGLSF